MSVPCPKCGGPGGVLLLFNVSPCDPCRGAEHTPKSAGRRWVKFDPGDVVGADWIGWDSYSGSKDSMVTRDRYYATLPDPNGREVTRGRCRLSGAERVFVGGEQISLIPIGPAQRYCIPMEVGQRVPSGYYGWAIAGDPP